MIFLVASFLFASLSNHSGITVILSLFSIFPYLLVVLKRGASFPKFTWNFVCLIFVVLSGFTFLLNLPNYKVAEEFNIAFLSNFIKYIILVIYIYIVSLIYINDREKVINACKWVLIAHITIFFIQFLMAYMTGYYLDFVLPFIGEASRYKFYGVASSLELYRCTGLFIEPSTYAVSVYCLLIILKTKSSEFSLKLERFTLASIFLSLSTISIVIVILHYVVKFAPKIFNIKKLIPILFLVLLSLLGFTQTELYNIQMEKFKNTSGIRFGLVDAVLERNEALLIFGSGLYGIEERIIEGSKGHCAVGTDCGSQINRKYASPADSGLLFYLFIKFGVFTLPILICVVYPFLFSFEKIGLFSILLLTKIQFAFPLIWLLVIMLRESNERYSSSNEMAPTWRR